MKKTKLLLVSMSALCAYGSSYAQTFLGKEAEQKIKSAQWVEYSAEVARPTFVEFQSSSANFRLAVANPLEMMKEVLALKANENLISYRVEDDDIGFTHTRYQQTFKGIPVEGAEYIAHQRGGLLNCINGKLFDVNENVSVTPSLNEATALAKAIEFVGAKKYMWEDAEDIALMREASNDHHFNYDPTSELVIYSVNNDFVKGDFRLAYKIDIYAAEPLSRAYYFVDATTGEIIGRHERIHTADVEGTAATRYSGSQKIMTTQKGSSYVLQETDRLPAGIKTFNCKTTKSYTNTDFTNTSTTWNLSNAAPRDNAALDAHWATEKMYDFLKQEFNRNSIDNAGMAMLNYVHYDVNYLNAFWDGSRMTYGDGNSTSNNNPLTSIDIGGHEVTHGVTERSAQLVYQNESGALNESYSDIFGKTLEHWARPNKFSWNLGTDLGWVLRSMENPGSVSQKQPMYYKGANWYSGTGDNGGVHYNSGVQNFWYYLIVTGKTGTNEKGQAYSIKSIGFDDAIKIVYRTLTQYMQSNSVYTNARTNSIKAAVDLFGDCSPQVIAVTDAWAAVGVGEKANCAVAPSVDFSANSVNTCDGVVKFTDKSGGSPISWAWDFGDGGTSTDKNPTHTYTASGTYTVKLKATNANGSNNATKQDYITVNIMTPPTAKDAERCGAGIVKLSATGANTINWYKDQTGGSPLSTGADYSPDVTTTTTYYVENSAGGAVQKVGPADNSLAGAMFTTNADHGMYFDVQAACVLKSVKVYAGSAGDRIIDVQDNSGTTILTKTVTIPAGESRVALDFQLPVGNSFFIKISGSLIDLYRAAGGATFPYTLAGVLSITKSDVESSNPGYYYFFYDWEVQTGSACASARIPVKVTINEDVTKPVIDYDGTTLSTKEESGYTYQWFLDGNKLSGETKATYAPNGKKGSYTVVVSNGKCGATSDPFTSVGISTNALDKAVRIYPNPARELINIELPLSAGKEISVQVFSVIGKLVYAEAYVNNGQVHQISLNSIEAKGVYFLRLQSGNEQITRKVTLAD